jgi:alanyl-tRNA synthetase
MQSTTSLNSIRSVFLNYFEKNNHTVAPSSPLVPHNDPTLLFTNAGMVQFKNYFTGKESAPFKRAATAQKCVRAGGKHNDLENVGYTARHHTFFEMLGNFSFGDYFKEEAIYHAWQVVTKEYGINPDRLYITVFSEDLEARELWGKIAGLPSHRIIGISTSDNFWSMGDTGPCGPCSEIFYDHGEHIFGGPPGSKDQDGDRFVEIWNLVFMQYEQFIDGHREPLPKPCIDTGIGLERIAAVLQGKENNFDTDLFSEIRNEIRRLGADPSGPTQSYQVIADHIRAICFLIADGVLPLNEGRGYVLRRIMRRAIRHARTLCMKTPALTGLVCKVVDLMGDQYDELRANKKAIEAAISDEEQRFGETLDFGLKLVEESVDGLSGTVLPGRIAFKLYDTYGFPVDLTADILRAKGLTIDMSEFDEAMQEQKERSKKAGTLGIKSSTTADWGKELANIPPTLKCCYCKDCGDGDDHSEILFIQHIDQDRYAIILNKTSFYPEAGGQVGDIGVIKTVGSRGSSGESGYFEGKVVNTSAISNGGKEWICHECSVLHGSPRVGDVVDAKIDKDRRRRICAHHSATHLLHAGLRAILNDSVRQKGSLVDADRLRFDFSYNMSAVSPEDLEKVELWVNRVILRGLPCRVVECSMEGAKQLGALAFFEEKYGGVVRVVQLGNTEGEQFISQELCCGTHVSNTGEIGLLKILSENGVSSGVRRIEAVCGLALADYIKNEQNQHAAAMQALLGENKQLHKQIAQLKTSQAYRNAEQIREVCNGINIIFCKVRDVSAAAAREIAEDLYKKERDSVVVVIGVDKEAVTVVACVHDQHVEKVPAKKIIQLACACINGKGGGTVNIAQCSSQDIPGAELSVAANALVTWIRAFIKTVE